MEGVNKVFGSGNPAAIAALARGDLKNARVAATPGGIEAQEKAGQQALVASTDMPKDMSPDRAAFEKLGFTFGEPVDDLFIKATLPAGWARSATSHSMHSDILDEKGRRRVAVFYKAAFYDRSASATLVARYSMQRDYDLPQDQVSFVVKDAGREIYRTTATAYKDYKDSERHREVATKWLTEAIPNAFDQSAFAASVRAASSGSRKQPTTKSRSKAPATLRVPWPSRRRSK